MDVPDLALIAGAAAFGFFVKPIAGFGGPLLAIPLLAPTLGVEHSIVVLSFGNVLANAMLLWEHRWASRGTSRLLVPLLAAGAVGTALSTQLLTIVDDRWLSLIVALTVLVYVARSIVNPHLHLTPANGRRLLIPVGLFGGIMHGATGNSGQVFGTYLNAVSLPRSEFIFTVTVLFLVLSSIQITTLVGLGSFTSGRTAQAAITIVPVVIATAIGTRVARRVPAAMFRRIVLVMLAFAALRLLVTTV